MRHDDHGRPVMDLKRILIVKLADLGDAVLAAPAISAIRNTFPKARLDVLTTPVGAEVLALCPAIDRLITFPKSLFDRPTGILKPANGTKLIRLGWRLRRGRYDALVLLHHLTTPFGARKFQALARASGAPIVAGLDNGRGGFLTRGATDYGFGERAEWEYGVEIAKTIGGEPGSDPYFVVPEAARIRAEMILRSHGLSKPFVIIHPGVGRYSLARRWPIERFAEVAASLIAQESVSVAAVGTRDERVASLQLLAEAGVVDLMGETSVASLAAILSSARVVIGADSGICHLAAALGTPTISIFGPSNHRAWSPIGSTARAGDTPRPQDRHVVLRSAIPCSPCFYVGYELGRPDGCRLRTCLQQVTSVGVSEAARRVLAQNVRLGAFPG